MIKTAVIGASGYIGSHLFRKYRTKFPDCVGTNFLQMKEGLIPFDLREPKVEDLKLEETQHKAVIISSAKSNIAWCEANPKESYQLNVRGTLQLVKQLEKLSLHILFLSSDYVFDGQTGSYSDQAPINPITEYGRQKAEVERELPNLTNKYTIIRLSKIYGTKWKDNTLIDAFASNLLKGEKIMVATDQFFSPTHINDIASMIFYTQEQGLKGLLNVCKSNPYSRYQIALKLVEELKVSSSLLEGVPLHSISGMEICPLNTSIVCSPCLQQMQPSLLSIDKAIKEIASNWNHYQL